MPTPTNAQLKTELTTDPGALGYVPANGDIGALTKALNQVRAGAAADGKSYSIFRNDVLPIEIVDAIAAADFTGLTAALISKLQLLFIGNMVDMTRTNARANFQSIFSGMSATTTNAILAAIKRNGSRAEAMWGTGVIINDDMVRDALKS